MRPERGSTALLASLALSAALAAALAPVDPAPRLVPSEAPACLHHDADPATLGRAGRLAPNWPAAHADRYVRENTTDPNPWSNSSSGNYQSVDLTYSFLPLGHSMPPLNGADSGGQNVLQTRLDALFGDTATWKELFRRSFDRWAEITGNTYTEVSDDGASWPSAAGSSEPGATRGDIRIGMRSIDGIGGFLGFNDFPPGGDMVLDADENWGINNVDFLFLRNTVMHEHGHGLGLAHVCPRNFTKLMEPVFAFDFDGPQLDDIRGAHRMYGDPLEPNNARAEATTPDRIGLIANQALAFSGASLHGNFDSDYYEVPVVNPSTLSTTITPVGAIYDDEPVDNSGLCSFPYAVTNALVAQNLILRIFDESGVQIAFSSAAQSGQPESITDLPLDPGTYFIRVTSGTSSSDPNADVQLYDLEVLLSDGGVPGDLSGDGCVSPVDLSILLSRWGDSDPAADLDNNGVVGPPDLSILLAAWGSC